MFSEYLTANKNCVRKGEVLLTDSSVLVTEPEIARAIHRVLSHGFVLVVYKRDSLPILSKVSIRLNYLLVLVTG